MVCVIEGSEHGDPDTLDARRAAREVLGRPDLAVPHARSRREALRALESVDDHRNSPEWISEIPHPCRQIPGLG